MLLGTVTDPYPLVAGACATGKFGLIILGLLYSAVALVVYFVTRKKALACSR